MGAPRQRDSSDFGPAVCVVKEAHRKLRAAAECLTLAGISTPGKPVWISLGHLLMCLLSPVRADVQFACKSGFPETWSV